MFISDKLEGFFLCSPLNDIFMDIFWKYILFFSDKDAKISYLAFHFNSLIYKMYIILACVACLCLLRCQARSLPSSKIRKTIYKNLNKGFSNRLKLLKVHLTLCKTGLNAEEKGQLFFNSEFKEFLLPFCTGRNNWKSTCGYVARMWQNQSYLYTFGSYFRVFIIYDIVIMQPLPLNLRSLVATVSKVRLIFHCSY